MVGVNLLGLMAGFTKENILKIKSVVMVFLYGRNLFLNIGQMVENIEEIGHMVSSMEMENFSIRALTYGKEENGLMAEE